MSLIYLPAWRAIKSPSSPLVTRLRYIIHLSIYHRPYTREAVV
jgi:hypothetical protein